MRIALGTAQFGMEYGIANASGRVALGECAEIMSAARAHGVDTVDTAVAYGESESVLGNVGVRGLRVVTKLPALPDDVTDIDGWVRATIGRSLARLNIDMLDAVLLHRPAQLLGRRGDRLYGALVALKSQGMAGRIGISIYGPEELDAIITRFPPDIVQAPFNVIDRRLESSGWLCRLTEAGVEVHTRSAFLQGLLLVRERPPHFDRWSKLLSRWSDWVDSSGATPVQACIQFALSRPGIQRVVVGVDSADHLLAILAAAATPCLLPPDEISATDIELVDPSRWKLSATRSDSGRNVAQMR